MSLENALQIRPYEEITKDKPSGEDLRCILRDGCLVVKPEQLDLIAQRLIHTFFDNQNIDPETGSYKPLEFYQTGIQIRGQRKQTIKSLLGVTLHTQDKYLIDTTTDPTSRYTIDNLRPREKEISSGDAINGLGHCYKHAIFHPLLVKQRVQALVPDLLTNDIPETQIVDFLGANDQLFNALGQRVLAQDPYEILEAQNLHQKKVEQGDIIIDRTEKVIRI